MKPWTDRNFRTRAWSVAAIFAATGAFPGSAPGAWLTERCLAAGAQAPRIVGAGAAGSLSAGTHAGFSPRMASMMLASRGGEHCQQRRKPMKVRTWTAVLLTGGALAAGGANGQSTTPAGQNPLDVVPEKMPFSTPYGTPISLEKAQAVVQAAVAEANKHGWPLNIAVVDSGANLITFVRMDGAQVGSIAISEHKARAAAKFRRPTKVFEDAMQQGRNYLGTLDDVVASRGGIPLVEDNKIIGAIGCSGATGSQDEVVCMAGAAIIK
jgi:glc operon protein GlcG